MKLKFALILILCIFIASVFSKTSDKRSHLRSKRMKHLNHKRSGSESERLYNATPKAVDNSTNSTDTGPLILNSVGRKVYVSNSTDIVLTSFPFEVTRCDQVVSFNGSFIPDLAEYRARKPGHFTLTAHYANLFSGNNPKNLLRSILLSETTIAPRIFGGSGGCIMIYSKFGGNNNIQICLDDNLKEQNILEVLKTFNECRGGNSLNRANKIDPLKVAQMIKTCSGKGKFVNPFNLIKKLKKKNMKVHKDKDWFHPGFDGVPGTQGTENKEDNNNLQPTANKK